MFFTPSFPLVNTLFPTQPPLQSHPFNRTNTFEPSPLSFLSSTFLVQKVLTCQRYETEGFWQDISGFQEGCGEVLGEAGGHNSGGSDRGVKEKRTWETLVRFWGEKGKERRGRRMVECVVRVMLAWQERR
jgi:hypothetical protein